MVIISKPLPFPPGKEDKNNDAIGVRVVDRFYNSKRNNHLLNHPDRL